MWLAVVALVAGAVVLVAGAESFTEHLVPAARRLGVTAFGLALLVAGAEPEEAWTAAWASGRGLPDLALGDAVGANLVIASLTLGLLSLVAPWRVTAVVRRYALAAAAVSAALAVLIATSGVTRPVGAALVVAYALGVGLVWRRERRPPAIGESGRAEVDEPSSGRAVLLAAVGLVAMVVGGVVVVAGAERLVTETGLDGTEVGVVVLGLATSVEMLALVWSARRRELQTVALAGLLGAIVYNATLTVGLAGLVEPLLPSEPGVLAAVAGVAAGVTLLVALAHGRVWGRAAGVALLALYVACVGLLLA